MKRSIFLSLMLFVGFSIKSQILYTNPEPDIIIHTPLNSTEDSTVYLEIDINQDGINDFKLFARHYFEWVTPGCCWNSWNAVMPINMGQILRYPAGYPSIDICMVPISVEDTVDADGYWDPYDGPLNMYIITIQTYCIQPSDNQFYGFRLSIEENFHYGWLRISSNLGVLVFRDMAINLTPNEFIRPGQIITGTNFSPFKDYYLSISPNPAKTSITITTPQGQPVKEAIFYNHFGQKALEAVPVNNTVDVSKLRPGIYFIEVVTSESRAGTKLVVE